jgi:hypothetical protein
MLSFFFLSYIKMFRSSGWILIRRVRDQTGGHQSGAARLLGFGATISNSKIKP